MRLEVKVGITEHFLFSSILSHATGRIIEIGEGKDRAEKKCFNDVDKKTV